MKNKLFWFFGGFGIGLTLLSMGQAALLRKGQPQAPKNTASPPPPSGNLLMEMHPSAKVTAPDLEQDYKRLTALEGKYAESADQQNRLKTATSKVAKKRNRE